MVGSVFKTDERPQRHVGRFDFDWFPPTVTIANMWLLLFLLAVSPEEQEVVATVQKLFDAMAAHDGDAASAVTIPEGRVFVVRATGETGASSTLAQFAERLPTIKGKILERMWKPEVRVDGRMATLWAPYDFHRDGQRTHCGIDAVDLVKTASGWKISGISYTVVTEGCPVSPLGAP